MFAEFGFVTVWHLTDVGNLKSILEHGLLARKDLEYKKLNFEPVGMAKIVASRPERTQDMVLTFVIPYNAFIRGRVRYHKPYHPNSRGLALLEIDLQSSILGREDSCFISNGNLAKQKIETKIGKLNDFVNMLNWNAMLDRYQENEHHTFGAQAEVLIPSPISPSSIRRVWVENQTSVDFLESNEIAIPVFAAEEFFANQVRIPAPAIHNFQTFKMLSPTKITHPQFGQGILVCNLGGRCVAKFEAFGLQLIRFGTYDWL